jgi:hypothetical protein
MFTTRKQLACLVAVATAALVVLTAGPAQGAPDKGNGAAGAAAAKADPSLAPDRVGGPTVAVSSEAVSMLSAIQRRIADYVAKNGTAYTFSSYVDGTTGKLVIESDAPDSLVSSLTKLSSASATSAERLVASQAMVRHGTISDDFSRRDDTPPFWGGAGISSGGGICSNGYAVRDNSTGVVSMTTAGHCFNVGSTVLTESGANTVGTVSNRHLPTITGEPRDVELTGGQSYAGRIYTGGTTSSTSVPVFAAGEAVVGFTNYCHSGRTSGEQCGHTANSITGQVCTATGCKSPVIVWTGGGASQGGDSGSPFYVMDSSGRAWIRGHVIAGDGVTSYSEKWTAISPLLNVSIVTG